MSLLLKNAPLSSAGTGSALFACLAIVGLAGCDPQNPGGTTPTTTAIAAAAASSRDVDILVMVDNSSSMTSMQQKMLAQIPMFVSSLQSLPEGLPNIHLAVVSSDMGAPSDQFISCSTIGDNGVFFSAPQGSCAATTLRSGATFITDDATGTTKNFDMADPAGLATVFQCIALLGASGCGFEHQLASVARALGADGKSAPAQNAGFLRDDAELAIIFLTNEDDCSGPPSNSPEAIYSLSSNVNNLEDPDGPLGNFRCNGGPLGGHLCMDPTGPHPTTLAQPPLQAPTDAIGTPPALNLTNCESNDTSSSGLIPVSTLIAQIKALKARPNSDIVVGAIMAPSTPYVVEWTPGLGQFTGELWPNVEHSCGSPSAGDSSFGDPPVRIAQFVQAFGDNGLTASICDSSYGPAFQVLASKIAAHLPGLGSSADGGGGTGGSSGSTGTIGMAVGGSGGGATSPGAGGTGGIPGNGGASGIAGVSGNGGVPGGGVPGSGGVPGNSGVPGNGGLPGDAGGPGAGGQAGAHPAGGAGGHAGVSLDGGAADGGETIGKGGGCGCETGGSPAGASGLALLVGLLLAPRSRRRALRRSGSTVQVGTDCGRSSTDGLDQRRSMRRFLTRRSAMNKDQIDGKAQNIKGRVKEAAGALTGNKGKQADGLADRVAGAVRGKVGDVKHDAARRIDRSADDKE